MNSGYNQFAGTILPELGNLSNLSGLYLHENQLTDVIPTELFKLTQLQNLWLALNQLSGELPPELGVLSEVDAAKRVIAMLQAMPEPGEPSSDITVNAEPGVTVYPPSRQDVPQSSNPVFVFEVAPGLSIANVLLDGYSLGAVDRVAFPEALSDHALEILTVAQVAQFAVGWKKCVDNDTGEKIACEPGQNATIIAGDQVCDSECMQFVIPFTQGTSFPLKVIPDPGATFKGWGVNGKIIDPDTFGQIIYTLEDLAVRPVIGHSSDG